MSGLLKNDSAATGILLALGSEFVTGLILWLVLLFANIPLEEHIRWFGVCFVPPLLILRHFAKRKQQPFVTKTIIVVLFVTFILFMFLLFKTKSIVL